MLRLVPVLLCILLAPALVSAQEPLTAASYTESGELRFPTDTESWIFVGTTLGGDYSEEPFDPAVGATFGVVQMEPAAYRHFIANGAYADGTMLLLSFHTSATKSEPQLQGLVQGELEAQEIHVIDKARFAEGRAFFFYAGGGQATPVAERFPEGSECVSCHIEHGAYDGTFTQFYPLLRSRDTAGGPAE